jgi:hypothetical protein
MRHIGQTTVVKRSQNFFFLMRLLHILRVCIFILCRKRQRTSVIRSTGVLCKLFHFPQHATIDGFGIEMMYQTQKYRLRLRKKSARTINLFATRRPGTPDQASSLTLPTSLQQVLSNSELSLSLAKNKTSKSPPLAFGHNLEPIAVQRSLIRKREQLELQSPKNTFHCDEISSGQRKIHLPPSALEGSEHSTGSSSLSNTMIQAISSFRGRANKRFRQHRNGRLNETQPTAPKEVKEDLDLHLDFQNHDIISDPSRNGPQPPRRVVPLHALLKQRECTARRLNCSHLPQRFKVSVPFSRLETPRSEAVLGLDCEGQYAVALAGTDGGLALKFYGVPSRDQIERRRTKRLPCMSPLLQTVRLNMPLQDGFHHESLVANFSVQIVTSNDWKIGVAIIRHSKSSYGARVCYLLLIFSGRALHVSNNPNFFLAG